VAKFKHTMIFTYFSGITADNQAPVRLGGWSESYYSESASAATLQAFGNLARSRVSMCPRGTSINRLRYQQVDPVGPAQLTKVSFPAPDTWLSGVPQKALKIQFALPGEGGQMIREFRGVPDVQFTTGEYTPTAPYVIAVNGFLNALLAGTWLVRRRDKGQPQAEIKSISIGGVVEMIQPLAGAANGNSVQILRTVNPASGRKFGYFAKIIAFTDERNFTIAGPKVRASGFGKMRLAVNVYPPFVNPQIANIEAVVRKIGRPFRSYSGRASNKQ